MRFKTMVYMFFFTILFGGTGYGAYLLFQDMEGPTFELVPNTGRVSPETPLHLAIQDPSGVRSVTVSVRKQTRTTEIFSKHFSPYNTEDEVTFNLKASGLREGTFDLEIKVVDASLSGFGLGNSRTTTLPMRLDTKPPRITVKTSAPYVRRGGAAVIAYTVDEDVQRSGIMVGDYFFSGYKQANGTYLSYFTFPYKMPPDQFKPKITAQDLAGNTTTTGLSVRAVNRTFKQDKITVTDAFLEKVSQRLYDLAPNAASPLDRFLIINRDIRQANTQFLMHIAADTQGVSLWDGSFMRLPRSASRASYGDHRTYVYKGKTIDSQSHLGFDLASTKHAPIPAANDGRVIFAGDLGIYGKLVVLDHGLGLMSLYSHLSTITASVGQILKKGDTLGNTGISGMAFGDHVHFGILVGGLEVNPLEWLDAKWIRDNITGRLQGL